MSVIIIGRFKADAEKMKALFQSRKDDFVAIREEAERRGAKHHQFAANDGEALFIDEWDSHEAFQAFFHEQTKIPEMMREVGATEPPSLYHYEVLDSPDKF